MLYTSFITAAPLVHPIPVEIFIPSGSQNTPWWESWIPLLVGILTIISGFYSIKYNMEKGRRIEIEKQLSGKKYEMYVKLIDYFLSLLDGKLPLPQHEDKVNEVRKLLIYGSDEVIRAYIIYLEMQGNESIIINPDLTNAVKEEEIEIHIQKVIGNLLLAIRKDMGNHKTDLKFEELIYAFRTSVVPRDPTGISFAKRSIHRLLSRFT